MDKEEKKKISDAIDDFLKHIKKYRDNMEAIAFSYVYTDTDKRYFSCDMVGQNICINKCLTMLENEFIKRNRGAK